MPMRLRKRAWLLVAMLVFLPGCSRKALHRIGPAARDAVPALVEALADGDAELRSRAAGLLGGVGPAAKDAVPALARALADEHEEVRVAAIVALGDLGPVAAGAVPALTR